MNFFNSVILNKNNLINNINVIKNEAKNKKVCAMVKANAYNHNLKFTVLALKNYVDFFGVANSEEALKVRTYAYKNKILICGTFNKEKLKELISNNISLTIFSIKNLTDILKVCRKNNLKAKVHIKLNTGMNRLGIKSKSYLLKVLEFINIHKNYLILEGVFSHLFNSVNASLCKMQYFKFIDYLNVIRRFTIRNELQYSKLIVHLENSGGLFNHIDYLNICSMVRVGISLYGLENYSELLKPVLSLNSKIIAIQKVSYEDFVGYGKTLIDHSGQVAVVPIGYADGILKSYKDCYVYILNKKCKILNVCMDMILVDISKIKAKIGDDVEIISNNKLRKNSADNLAKMQNTISYEIVTNLNYNRLNLIEK